jgi:hypothetical protein
MSRFHTHFTLTYLYLLPSGAGLHLEQGFDHLNDCRNYMLYHLL